ncbi:putative Ig domain-containing protein, partial [Streptococcus dentasini]
DGEPDVTDVDDDGDGLSDDQDQNPKRRDTTGPLISASDQTVLEKTPFEIEVSVSDNDDPSARVTAVTGLPAGVSYDSASGKISGSADQEIWTSDEDESHAYPVTIEAIDGAGNATTKEITIQVQRDTDGDGEPDVTDVDDDGDGLSDDQDQNPKRRDTTGPLISASDQTVFPNRTRVHKNGAKVSSSKSKETLPKTGDSINYLPYLGVAFLLIPFTFFGLERRRRNSGRD